MSTLLFILFTLHWVPSYGNQTGMCPASSPKLGEAWSQGKKKEISTISTARKLSGFVVELVRVRILDCTESQCRLTLFFLPIHHLCF
jgi:hypothetical protein